MGTFQSFKKAYGALKDSTKVGLAKELDVAIVKATNHEEHPPKERHVQKILFATSAHQPRVDVTYCIQALSRRLSKTRSWTVAIKTLIIIHRTLREGDPTFKEELLNYTRRGNVLQISNFQDDSNPRAWDCSAWIRAYALFLEERIECLRILKYDVESEPLPKSSPGLTKVYSSRRMMGCDELLEQLPALQQLLYRLTSCRPEGAAYNVFLIQYALALVLKESFKIYCAINDGIINLVDMFFDMSRHEAVKALNIYKRAGQQGKYLAEFYEYCKGLDIARNFQLPTLQQPPPSFLATMEEYIKEAPQTGSVHKRLEYSIQSPCRKEPEEPEEPIKTKKQDEEVNEQKPSEAKEEIQHKEVEAEPSPLILTDSNDDLLGLNEIYSKALELEESNALALAITPSDETNRANPGLNSIIGTSGWELALATAPSNNANQAPDSTMAGGFDKLLLDSLYEDGQARRQLELQNAGYGIDGMTMQHNPFDQNQNNHDPFAMSNNMAPPTNVQMALLAQQEQLMFQQRQQQQYNMMVHHDYPQTQYPQQMQHLGSNSNPFTDPLPIASYPQSSLPQQGNYNLL